MAWMAQTKRTVGSRPKPRRASGRSKQRRKQAQPHHNAEIVGLGLVAAGIFLACVLWFGLSGGPVARAVTDAVGWAAYVAPVVLCPVGALIVTRSALVSVRPFRFGLALAVVGPDARPRREPRRFRRQDARVVRRARRRLDRLDDPRRPADARRRALPHRRVARRPRPALGPRGPDGLSHRLDPRAARAAAPRAGGPAARGRAADLPSACVRAASPARAARRRRPGLPGPRLGGAARAAAAARPVVPDRRPDRRDAGVALRDRDGARERVPAPGSRAAEEVEGRRGAEHGRERPHGRGAAAVPGELRRRGDGDRPDLGPARHPLRAPARRRGRRSRRSRS